MFRPDGMGRLSAVRRSGSRDAMRSWGAFKHLSAGVRRQSDLADEDSQRFAEILVDDPQFCDITGDPFVVRVQLGRPLADDQPYLSGPA
ncbi:hypothetical protein [Paracoccus xiamenensis]|uniref:hypothetical protein n=1 Tax=Paracoccus xiamenensis TaxID=2714901 RepID=UPI00140C7454|nr:hypothetical protein [Paracoccus xiamenensis]NHF72042.1 hypothetical protein [Paracoccus xiamenensis]